ncbi:MAG: hypothetical protein ABIH82_06460 [Candidatus Woesearchaeota archaeon]
MTEKKVNKSWLPIAIVFGILALGFILHDVMESPETVIPDGYVPEVNIATGVDIATAELSSQLTDANSRITDLTNQVSSLTTKLTEKIVEEIEQVKESLGYLIDEIFLNTNVDKTLSDREVKTLFDGKVEVGDEKYDAEEVIELDNLKILANGKDFEGIPYLTIPRDAISYKVVFEDDLDTSTIDDDENSLVFNFLGKEVKITNWAVDTVTLFEGESFFLDEGESVVVDGKTVLLQWVSDNDNVYVTVDGVGKELAEGETKTINGLQVKADMVIFNSVTPKLAAQLIVGKDVENELIDGDEFEEDSIWEYQIDEHSIGIVLKDEFNQLRDNLKPLAVSETVCLPNEYVCVRFDGMSEEDMNEVTFELDTRDSVEYVEVRGVFQSGLDDFTKLYIKRSDGNIFDKDLVEITEDITIGDSDSKISVVVTDIVIEDFTVNLDLDVSSVGDDDSDFMSDFGIFVTNPENSVEDQSWRINVPDNRLEGMITVL